MKIGMVGLGRMGGKMAERLRRQGHEVVGYDSDPELTAVASLAELVAAVPVPKVVWVMLPAGEPTESTISELGSLLDKGDIVVDGGNSYYRDSIRRASELTEKGIDFVDVGTSGGVWGLEEGYSLMVGGEDAPIATLEPIFRALAAEGGFAHLGSAGAGHFTKMVHNGVEYGLMESYAEGYEILASSRLGIDAAAAMRVWQHGSVVRSWLLDLLVRALEQHPGLVGIVGVADDSGEGRWTLTEAVESGVPAPAIAAALFARFESQRDDSPAMKVVAALRNQFGGHPVHLEPGGTGTPGGRDE